MTLHWSTKAIVGLIIGGISVTGGSAIALWSSNAVGLGDTEALSAVSITVSATTGTADLYPGFTQGKVFFTAANPNPYPVTLNGMTPGTITSSDPTNCPASNVTVTSGLSLGLLVPANATATPGSIPDVVTMATTAPDGCQAVVFTIALTLSGTQS